MHDDTVRRAIGRFRGREVKSPGDGFLATIDGPGRAVKCARDISPALRRQGREIRAGLHTGEVEKTPDDVRGIAVHVAARAVGRACANDVLVSRTVRDLVAGSGLVFHSVGTRALAGRAEPTEICSAGSPARAGAWPPFGVPRPADKSLRDRKNARVSH